MVDYDKAKLRSMTATQYLLARYGIIEEFRIPETDMDLDTEPECFADTEMEDEQ